MNEPLLNRSRVIDGVTQLRHPQVLVVVDADDDGPRVAVDAARGGARLQRARAWLGDEDAATPRGEEGGEHKGSPDDRVARHGAIIAELARC